MSGDKSHDKKGKGLTEKGRLGKREGLL